MERRPAPVVTIEGGQGWQLDAPREDTDAVLDTAPAPDDRRRRVGALVLAAALGFGAATALAEARTTTLADSDAGVLSLEVQPDPNGIGGSLVTGRDGRVSLSTTVVVRNTGPRPVAFQRAELVGTPYATDDLAGRRVGEGGQAVLSLLRPVECTGPTAVGAPGPLRVTATTGTGTRSVDLRMDTSFVQFHGEQVAGACGRNEPSMALVVSEQVPLREGARLVLRTRLGNASARPLLVTGVQPQSGLRVVELRDGEDRAVELPLGLPGGDFDAPVDPFAGRGQEQDLVVVLEVEDCARLPRVGPDYYLPTLEVTLSTLDGRTGGSAWGGDPQPLQRLREDVCGPSTEATRGDVGPSLAEISEQALHALRRDHPFLTPD